MYNKFVINSLIISLLGLSFAFGTEVEDCHESTAPQPIFVDIKGCDKQPCPLYAGQNVVMIMNFTAPEPIEKLRATVLAQPEGNEGSVNFPLPRGNVCNELLNTHCPLEINEPAVYKLEMPILTVYPKIGLRLEFAIKHNGGSDNLVCFSVNCQVV